MSWNSLGDLLRTSCRKWPAKTAMLRPTKDGFKSITYKELWEHVRKHAAALRELGLEKGDRMCIQSENCPEWAFADWAAQCIGVIIVPIYPTLPADQAQHIIKDSGAKVIISGSEEQEEKAKGVAGLRVVGLEELQKLIESALPMTNDDLDSLVDQAKPDEVATIIYTSGTTGAPKGAMLQHQAFTFLMEAIVKSLPINQDDTFLSFLPMSHVYERVAGQVLPISCGATIAYAQSLRTLASDMVEVKPTIMLCVPRFLEATMDKIQDGVSKQKPLQQKLFGWTLAQGTKRATGEFALFAGILDGIVGKKIRDRTGGRIRFFVSGGAALPPHVSYFYMAFNLKVLQGYGLTETTAASCVNHPDRNKPWTVGEPIPGVDVKIASDGEILIKGPSRMLGYYNMPEDTKAAIDAAGWFHTGDIGEFEGKYLKITDRKKDLLVLANGKNIAPQPIENKLRESPLISEAVLFGDGMEYVCALIVPNFEALKRETGEPKDLIKAEIDKVNKTLADFEKVKKHSLLDEPLTIEGGELTPTLKVKRKAVKEKYAAEIQAMGR